LLVLDLEAVDHDVPPGDRDGVPVAMPVDHGLFAGPPVIIGRVHFRLGAQQGHAAAERQVLLEQPRPDAHRGRGPRGINRRLDRAEGTDAVDQPARFARQALAKGD